MKKNNDRKNKSEDFQSHEAAEQTFSTWIQTGLTLIGFGFALGSVVALMKSEHYELFVIESIRIIAALSIIFGVISVVLALIQNRKKIKSNLSCDL